MSYWLLALNRPPLTLDDDPSSCLAEPVVTFLRDIRNHFLAFLAGAVILTLLAHLQHRFATETHSWKSFLVPVLVGGIAGAALYLMKQRVRELSAQLTSLSSSALNLESPLPARKKVSAILLILTTTLGLSLFLSIMSVVQKLFIGFPINPKGFIFPVLIGSIGGFLFGLYLNRLKQFQVFQTDAMHILSSQKTHLSNIIETIHDGILVTDSDRKIVLTNPAGKNMLGINQEGVQQNDLWASLTSMAVPYQSEHFSIPQHNTPFLVQARQTGKILRGAVNPILDNEGQETGLVLVLQDISYEKKIEQLKAEFISTATHELNTPISALAGYSELLLSGTFSAEQQKDFIETIGHKAWQVSNILDDMLNVDSVGSPSQIILNKTKYQICDLIPELEECTDQARERHLLELDIQDQKHELKVDIKRIKRIFCHLLSNACKFSTEGSLITIRGRANTHHYYFEVNDQGIGMSAEDCELVFDKFYRANATDTGPKGIGLGLNVVKTLVEAHDGEVLINSQPGQGTTIKFTLPLI